MTFELVLSGNPTTAQQKGAAIVNRQIHFYEKEKVRVQRREYQILLKEFVPNKPLEGPLVLDIQFLYPELKSKKMKTAIEPRIEAPDLDNVAKLFIDAMADMKFFWNDSQIVDLHLTKFRIQGNKEMRMKVRLEEMK